MYRQHLKTVLALFACVHQTTECLAQQQNRDSLKHLKEVVVAARQIQDEPIPAQKLKGKELERLNAHNVADALRHFSGVQIKDYGGIGGLKTINIRSMGTNHVGVFYDGVELGNAQNGQVDLGRFSLDNMESISLYNGQKGVLFQPAKDFASASSIYMQTRTPIFNDQETYHLKATFKTGSFGLANPALLWEQKISPHLSASLNAEYLYTTGKYRFSYRVKDGYDTTAVRHNGDVQSVRLEGGLFGRIPDGDWRTRIYFYRSERGYPGAVVRHKFTHEDRQWDQNTFVQGRLQKAFSDRYRLMVHAKYAYDYLHYLADPRLDETLMYTDNRYYQHEIYGSMAHLIRLLPHWDLNISTDYQMNLLNSDMRDFAYPRRHMFLMALATGGSWRGLSMQASVLGTVVHDRVKGPAPAGKDKMHWTPTALLSYQPWKQTDLSFRFFYKRIFRLPTLNDLYYTFIGNADLKPEFTNQYNAGFKYVLRPKHKALQRLEIQGDGYYNTVENKIIATPTSNFFRWTMINLGHVRIRGVDAVVETDWLLGRHVLLNGRVNYTFQRAEDRTDPTDEFYGGQIPYIPRHSGSAHLGLIYKRWHLDYSFIYTGERYASSANIPANYQLPWYTSDCALGYSQPLRTGELNLNLEVNNLLNQQYEVVRCYPMPGINFRIIAQYQF